MKVHFSWDTDAPPHDVLGYLEMVAETIAIPGGHYTIGADQIAEAEAPNPRHGVTVSAFRIAITPVTNAAYLAFVEETKASRPLFIDDDRFGDPTQPVVGVSFDEAVAYARFVGGSLPTEAQWEIAARGDDERRFPWGDEEATPDRACFGEDWNRGRPSRVHSFPAGRSAFGVQDMAGGVWEWCRDDFRKDAHRFREKRDPLVSGDSDIRPLRGGCWRSIEPKLQVSYRNWFHRKAKHLTIGFRVVFPS